MTKRIDCSVSKHAVSSSCGRRSNSEVIESETNMLLMSYFLSTPECNVSLGLITLIWCELYFQVCLPLLKSLFMEKKLVGERWKEEEGN